MFVNDSNGPLNQCPLYVPGSVNSHYFHIIGDGKNQPNYVGVYIPEIRIPSLKVGWVYPQKNATTLTMAHINSIGWVTEP